MNLNRCFSYPEITRTTRPDGIRHYNCPETHLLLPSVTTILSATADKTALKEWQEFVGEERAERERSQATGLGSLMHEHIEKHVLGEERPRGNNLVRVMARNMADQIIAKGLTQVDEVWGQEVALHYPGVFAGTTDLLGIYDGRQAVMDHKTTKKMKKRSQINDYFDQLSAYALSHDYHHGTKIEMGVVFMVSRDLQFEKFIIQGAELEAHKVSFLERTQKYMELHGYPEAPLAHS